MSNQQDVPLLIAEDDYLNSEMIKGLLEEIGYTVVGEAADGLEAVQMTQSFAVFSHGLCPECAKKLYPEIFRDDE